MVIRKRLRAILFPILLYSLCGAADAYFIRHAVNDDRGLKTDAIYEGQIANLRDNLKNLQQQRQEWEHKIALLSGKTIDRDLLEEEAYARLGRVGKNDVVVILDSASR
ncbi:MAG TPA: septum formation initiator family protein [Methylovirgula sp.]|nr:septum formation initiator family protein [Methylovirgula sp.]